MTLANNKGKNWHLQLMKFYVITDDENGMKITLKNLSRRFSHSEAISTCGLSLGTLSWLQPLFNPQKGLRSTQRGRLVRKRTGHMPSVAFESSSFWLPSLTSPLPPPSQSFTFFCSQGNTYSPPSHLNYNRQTGLFSPKVAWGKAERKDRFFFFFLSCVFLILFLNTASPFSPSLIPFKINVSSGFICSHWKKKISLYFSKNISLDVLEIVALKWNKQEI